MARSTQRRHCHKSGCPPGLNLIIYNVLYSRGFGLLQAIRATQIGNYDLVKLMETNILDAIYCKNSLLYDVACLRLVPNISGGI